MNTSITAGIRVQTISITVPSTKNLYLYLLTADLIINQSIKMEITGPMNITWSWRKVISSITGLAAS